MTQYNFIIDVEKCEDCNNCFLACKDEHVGNDWPGVTASQPRHGHRWMNIMRKERGTFPLIDVAYRPTPCMHCDDAPCIAATGSGKIIKRADGIVLIDPEKAKGDKNILKSCPYGAVYWNETEDVAQKCTLCAHLMDKGWRQPRCVQVCPTGALRIVKADDAQMTALAEKQGLEVLLPELNTSPRVYYKNLHLYKSVFIAGSVGVQSGDVTDCAHGAAVLLRKDGVRVAEAVTDHFGDYRFDGVEPCQGSFSLEIRYKDFQRKTVSIETLDNMTLPDILFV